ncbi:hypothetical protein KGF54_005224 [Candida jiufengensis]|uniref:uncharacterized protein n=1 Tax=Candida jiufengensis TaxID=497108 RepID=UPI0022257DA8|nr:uncharacterized protein KGF54_005224 [Candida jiufengensis]KAI5950267.1 hypothetical protein KGF54_005224 [Candida jiufengensis]
MINFEALLEFEESLSINYINDHKCLIQSIENKLNYLRINEGNIENYENIKDNNGEQNNEEEEDDDDKTSIVFDCEIELYNAINSYNLIEDEFLTCSKCGLHLNSIQLINKCCLQTKEFIQNQLTNKNSLDYNYWLSFIDNPIRTVFTLPYLTEFNLKNHIPTKLRSIIWKKFHLLTTCQIPNSINLIFKNFQHSYTNEISIQISKDVLRTFPHIKFFHNEKTIEDLSTILNLYSNYDLELGYCQGLIFLVGVLYYHLEKSTKMTFFALINIMELEKELHDIFTDDMSKTLNLWFLQFLSVLEIIDLELFEYFSNNLKIMKVFLFQWWLTFLSSHIPINGSIIINYIMDFCHFQSWKIGLFKLSLGLLIINKELIMNLNFEKDEEILLQILLNEDKWLVVLNNIDYFFSDLIFSWNDEIFLNLPITFQDSRLVLINDGMMDLSPTSKPLYSSFKALSQTFKQLRRSSHDRTKSICSIGFKKQDKSTSVVECKQDRDRSTSVISTVSTTSYNSNYSNYESTTSIFSNNFLKFHKETNNSSNYDITRDEEIDLLTIENEKLKILLRQSYYLLKKSDNSDNDKDEINFLNFEIEKILNT